MSTCCYGLIGWFAENGEYIETEPPFAITQLYFDYSRNARHEFSGAVFVEENNSFVGAVKDRFGVAVIEGLFLENVFSFTKQYMTRRDRTICTFKRSTMGGENFYRGTYKTGKHGKEGETCLVITKLPPEFFKGERGNSLSVD